MRTKKIIFIIIFTLIFSLCFPIKAYATNQDAGETETASDNGEGYDLFGEILENASNAKIRDESVQEIENEYQGGLNGAEIAKRSVSKFLRSFSNKEYDENDFNGNAEKVYSGFSGVVEWVINEGIIDTVYSIGQSCVRFFANIISAAADAAR